MNRRAVLLLLIGGGLLVLAVNAAGLWWSGLGEKLLARAATSVGTGSEAEAEASAVADLPEGPSPPEEEAAPREAELRRALKERAAAPAPTTPSLAEIYGSMRPQEAASVLARLEPRVAAKILKEMSPRKAARVLGAFEPAHAAAVTNEIMQVPKESAP